MGFWAPLGTSGGVQWIHKLCEQMLRDPEKLQVIAVRGEMASVLARVQMRVFFVARIPKNVAVGMLPRVWSGTE